MRSKGKAITLLSVLTVILAFVLVMTFIRFPIGVKNYNSVLGAIEFDYDLVGGTAYTYTLASDSEEVEDVDEVIKTVSDRLSTLGYKTYAVKALQDANVENASYDIRIEVRNTDSASEDVATAIEYGEVKFLGGTTEDPSDEIMNEKSAIEDAYYAGSYANEGTTVHQVALKFTDYGYEALKTAVEGVEEGSSFYLKIMLGDDVIMKASTLTLDGISDRTVYLTSGSEADAFQKALKLKTGGLDYKYELDNSQEITAPLGVNALLAMEIATGAVILFAIVVIFVFFKGYGFIGLISMLTFMAAILGMMLAVPGIVVSSYGVIGMILTALLTANGLLITASRIKKEFANGKTHRSAIKAGYNGSFYAVLGSCVVCAIIGLVGFFLLGGAIQSFAITLGIGSVIAFICSALLSRLFSMIFMPLIKEPEKFYGIKKEIE